MLYIKNKTPMSGSLKEPERLDVERMKALLMKLRFLQGTLRGEHVGSEE